MLYVDHPAYAETALRLQNNAQRGNEGAARVPENLPDHVLRALGGESQAAKGRFHRGNRHKQTAFHIAAILGDEASEVVTNAGLSADCPFDPPVFDPPVFSEFFDSESFGFVFLYVYTLFSRLI